jgi:anti-sigma B factor antagonist
MFDIRLGDKGEVVCEGRLDASQAAKAQEFLDALPAPDVVDMARLEYISSAGLGVLLRTQKRLLQAGGGLRLVNANRHVRDIFRYSGFDRIFQIEAPGD